jgi:hypothetical protein
MVFLLGMFQDNVRLGLARLELGQCEQTRKNVLCTFVQVSNPFLPPFGVASTLVVYNAVCSLVSVSYCFGNDPICCVVLIPLGWAPCNCMLATLGINTYHSKDKCQISYRLCHVAGSWL